MPSAERRLATLQRAPGIKPRPSGPAPPDFPVWDGASGVWRNEAGAARPAMSVPERRKQQQQERRKAAVCRRERDAAHGREFFGVWLRRSCEERARQGQMLTAFHCRLGALQTHVGVRSTACGPAHPVDGSRPRSRAWRMCSNGEGSVSRPGVPARSHAHVHTRLPTRSVLTLSAAFCRSPSARYLAAR